MDAETLPATESNQERWDNMCKMIKEKAKEAMGVRRKGTQPKDSMIVTISNEKFKLQKDIEACTDEQLRKEKCKRKKQLKKDIKARVKEIETLHVENRLANIEHGLL